MPGDLTLQLADAAQNPADKVSIRTQNRDFGTEALSRDESRLFEEQFNVLINDLDSRQATELYLQRQQEIADTLAVAKSQFDERLFGGINAADNEIGMDVLRPGHIRADPADGSSQNDWFYTHSDGWSDWIGDGTSSNDYQVSEDQVSVILGVMDTGTYIVEEDTGSLAEFQRLDYTATSAVNVERFGRNVDMLPKDLNDARTLDNENDTVVQALPTVMGTDRDRVHVRLRSDVQDDLSNANANIVSEPRLLGFTFGVGNFMNTEDY